MPARDSIAAPNPSVTATQLTESAMPRRTALATGCQLKIAASSHRPMYSTNPMKSARTLAPRAALVDPGSVRDQNPPVRRATARNPSASKPATAMQYATAANGISRIPITVKKSPMHKSINTGSAMI